MRARVATTVLIAIGLVLAGVIAPAAAAITLVRTIGTNASSTAGATLTVTVPPAGVAAGDSVILTFVTE